MGMKVMTVITTTATTKLVMHGMTNGGWGAIKNAETAVSKGNDVSNCHEI